MSFSGLICRQAVNWICVREIPVASQNLYLHAFSIYYCSRWIRQKEKKKKNYNRIINILYFSFCASVECTRVIVHMKNEYDISFLRVITASVCAFRQLYAFFVVVYNLKCQEYSVIGIGQCVCLYVCSASKSHQMFIVVSRFVCLTNSETTRCQFCLH